MTAKTLHSVTGVGKAITNTDETQSTFNPQKFELAMEDLQDVVLKYKELYPLELSKEDMEKRSQQTHTQLSENQIRIHSNTELEHVYNLLPTGWNASVVIDANENYDASYGVHASVHCGGGVNASFTILIRSGMVSRLEIQYTNITTEKEDDENITIRIGGIPSTQNVTQTLRTLSEEILYGYLHTFSSPAKALDYKIAGENPQRDGVPRQKKHNEVGQSGCAKLRGVKRQSVNGNVKHARDELKENGIDPFEQYMTRAMSEREPSLIELDEDDEDPGDIRLV